MNYKIRIELSNINTVHHIDANGDYTNLAINLKA